jgi:hypothetical protein
VATTIRNCENCRHWALIGGVVAFGGGQAGECRAGSPLRGGDGWGRWPLTLATHWCGHYAFPDGYVRELPHAAVPDPERQPRSLFQDTGPEDEVTFRRPYAPCVKCGGVDYRITGARWRCPGCRCAGCGEVESFGPEVE